MTLNTGRLLRCLISIAPYVAVCQCIVANCDSESQSLALLGGKIMVILQSAFCPQEDILCQLMHTVVGSRSLEHMLLLLLPTGGLVPPRGSRRSRPEPELG